MYGVHHPLIRRRLCCLSYQITLLEMPCFHFIVEHATYRSVWSTVAIHKMTRRKKDDFLKIIICARTPGKWNVTLIITAPFAFVRRSVVYASSLAGYPEYIALIGSLRGLRIVYTAVILAVYIITIICYHEKQTQWHTTAQRTHNGKRTLNLKYQEEYFFSEFFYTVNSASA